ncbi:MAG: transcriptional regulator, MarR family [Gemmatimonadetes bacterium]|jgi:MarR family 2-MHQ and catechol resistance regulon transcriptional repressor|nr:transcriptional regulator, MarR family [Gemmatimonadota bacterium]
MTTTPTGPETVLVVWKASRALEARALDSIGATGLGASDFKVLEALLHKGALPVNVLGRKLLLTSGSITTAVDRLVERGLVERHEDATDRRVRQVALTEAGRALIEPLYARHAADLEAVVRVLSDAERRTLVTLLRKLGLHAMTA